MFDNDFLPIIKFPTAIFSLDDDTVFLDSFTQKLKCQNITSAHTSSIAQAENILQSQQYADFNFFDLNDDGFEQNHTNNVTAVVCFDYFQTLVEKYSSQTFFSVLIVDYDMPEMTGVDFCHRIAVLPMKKIMLTGRADHEIAVAAFNQGIIDRFVLKDPKKIFSDIERLIIECQQQFFADISKRVLSLLLTNPQCALSQPAYCQKLKAFIEKHRSETYYLIDEFGSYAVIDADGQKHYFVARHRQHFEDYADIAENSEADQNLLQQLSKRLALPLLLNSEAERLPVSQWSSYLKNVNMLDECEDFYWAEC